MNSIEAARSAKRGPVYVVWLTLCILTFYYWIHLGGGIPVPQLPAASSLGEGLFWFAIATGVLSFGAWVWARKVQSLDKHLMASVVGLGLANAIHFYAMFLFSSRDTQAFLAYYAWFLMLLFFPPLTFRKKAAENPFRRAAS